MMTKHEIAEKNGLCYKCAKRKRVEGKRNCRHCCDMSIRSRAEHGRKYGKDAAPPAPSLTRMEMGPDGRLIVRKAKP